MTPQNAASHLGLYCLLKVISSKNEVKIKITPNTPKNKSGLIQLIMMGESILQIWVKIEGLIILFVNDTAGCWCIMAAVVTCQNKCRLL